MFHRSGRVILLHFVQIAVSVLAFGEPDDYALYVAPELPECWSAQGVVPVVSEDHPLTIRFSLKGQNLDQLVAIARRVSDPQSPEYGQYLSGMAVAELTQPEGAHAAAVTEWLSQAVLNFTVSGGGGVVELKLTTGLAAQLFQTAFRFVLNNHTGQQVVQALDYRLPASIAASVSAVYGLHGLPLPQGPRRPITRKMAAVTPAVLTKTYNVSIPAGPSTKKSQAVAEFQGQTMKKSDLATFFKKYAKGLPASDHTVSKFVGKKPIGDGGVEASLDIEYIMGVAPGVPTEFWYWGGHDFCADLKLWTEAIIAAGDDAPLVHSVSYGYQAKLSEIGCAQAKVDDVDANFAKLAAMGITVIFASGDSGSGYAASGGHGPGKKPTLYPSWPASSPWVTSVGSTRFVGQKLYAEEMATDQFGSGGGFSAMFPAFDDQKDAVEGYLKIAEALPPKGSFPPGGRGTPDVSALGEGFKVIADGDVEDVGGTSASAPTFAAIVSLLNQARLAAGKPAMGYMNPWLYKHPEAFTDITVGTNKIGRAGEKLKYGYGCAKGWDPVTGLGTPIFDKMLAAALGETTASQIIV